MTQGVLQGMIPAIHTESGGHDLNAALLQNLYAANATMKELGLELVVSEHEIAGLCCHALQPC